MTPRDAATGLLALAAVGVAAWLLWPHEAAPATAPRAEAQPAPQPQAPAVADGSAPDAPTAAAAKPAGSVRYPDGSTMPALNGVTTSVTLNWGVGKVTPVVGTVNGPGGWQWYVHANGAHSTTAMVTVNGVAQAMGFVAEAGQTLPPLDEESLRGKRSGTGASPPRR